MPGWKGGVESEQAGSWPHLEQGVGGGGEGHGGWRLGGFFDHLSAMAPLGEGLPQVSL